jgi:BirA family biotin operon repressor/biotin-[acetyl-CoA-carboxylase] ligase
MSNAIIQRLAGYLSVHETRSGEAIGNELGCSRTAVWKHVENLRSLGIQIDAVAGKGYILKQPLELLDSDLILDGLAPDVRETLRRLETESVLDSTNSALSRLDVNDQHAVAILAEHQSSGRGRRGRQWCSPFARNIYLSIGWKFENALSELGCLPLVVALATAKALSRAGATGHQVKWPNDLLLDGRKLCGCLVEVQGDSQGPCHAVLGVGINVHMPISELTAGIDQPWTDLQSQLPEFSRNALATLLLEELIIGLQLFAGQGFAPFRDYWGKMDGLKGQLIEVFAGESVFKGTASGINEAGALLLDSDEEMLTLYSGEVSMHKSEI